MWAIGATNTVHVVFCLRACRADAADADAICGGLGASFRVAVTCMPWNRDEPKNKSSEASLCNCTAPPSVVRSQHLHTRDEAEIEVRPSAKQGIRNSVPS